MKEGATVSNSILSKEKIIIWYQSKIWTPNLVPIDNIVYENLTHWKSIIEGNDMK